jgi:hypothetical protein
VRSIGGRTTGPSGAGIASAHGRTSSPRGSRPLLRRADHARPDRPAHLPRVAPTGPRRAVHARQARPLRTGLPEGRVLAHAVLAVRVPAVAHLDHGIDHPLLERPHPADPTRWWLTK